MSEFTRRQFLVGSAAMFLAGAGAAKVGDRLWARFAGTSLPLQDVVEEVTPSKGFQTSMRFGDTIQTLIEAGALDPGKFRAVYQSKGTLPGWIEQALTGRSNEPIVMSSETAPYLLNLLWPIGLATKGSFNDKSPINNVRLPSYASTAAWTLGREANGAAYFNRISTIEMTSEQEQMVVDVAQSTFRPCCDNSTFLQDCNHGSALLGLIELAAAQGASKADVYRFALMANSFWFPLEYRKTALYLAIYEGRPWKEASPRDILAPRLSTASGWQRNVNAFVQLARFVPRSTLLQMNGNGCGV